MIKKVYSKYNQDMRDCGIFLNGFANSLRMTHDPHLIDHTMPLVAADIKDNDEFVLYFEPASEGDLTQQKVPSPSPTNAQYRTQALTIMQEMATLLVAAHSHGVMHGDVKPSNFVVVKNNAGQKKIKFIDFDNARRPATEKKIMDEKTSTTFFPPESLQVDYQPGFATDMFALGYTFYELLTGDDVGRGYPKDALDRLRSDLPGITPETDPLANIPTISMKSDQLSQLPQTIRDIILRLTDETPSSRYTAEELLEAITAALTPTSLPPDCVVVGETVEEITVE